MVKAAFISSSTVRSLIPSSLDLLSKAKIFIIFLFPSCSRAFLSSGANIIISAVTAMVAILPIIHSITSKCNKYDAIVKPTIISKPLSNVHALVLVIHAIISYTIYAIISISITFKNSICGKYESPSRIKLVIMFIHYPHYSCSSSLY